MPISQAQAGTYLGYTAPDPAKGKNEPTLYFQNGHLTLSHDPANQGWHPNKGPTQARNVPQGFIDAYDAIRGAKTQDDQAKKDHMKKGFFENPDKFMGSADCYFEVIQLSDGSLIAHPSRSKLIAPGDPDFDTQYDQNFANAKLAEATLAANEN